MPLYEYQCKKCHTRFERIQKFSDEPIKQCPECGGEAQRLLSAPAVQFKGSGWYVTDYGRKSSHTSRPAATSDSPAKSDSKAADSSSGSSGSKESK